MTKITWHLIVALNRVLRSIECCAQSSLSKFTVPSAAMDVM